jgi:hypothetical protein
LTRRPRGSNGRFFGARYHQGEHRAAVAPVPPGHGTGVGNWGVRRRSLRDRYLLPNRGPVRPSLAVDCPAHVAVDGRRPGNM